MLAVRIRATVRLKIARALLSHAPTVELVASHAVIAVPMTTRMSAVRKLRRSYANVGLVVPEVLMVVRAHLVKNLEEILASLVLMNVCGYARMKITMTLIAASARKRKIYRRLTIKWNACICKRKFVFLLKSRPTIFAYNRILAYVAKCHSLQKSRR